MPKIIKNGLEYSGVPVEVVTAWAPTSDPVQVKEPLMGNTDISEIGDGSLSGAVSALNAGLTSLDGKRIRVATHAITTDGSGAAILPATYAFNAETGKRMLISVSIANTLKTCSNPGIASGGLPYVHVRNYDGTNCASTQVTLYCYYVQY